MDFGYFSNILTKSFSISFNLILDCFVAMYGEKKTINLLNDSKKSIRDGKHTQKQRQTRKTTKSFSISFLDIRLLFIPSIIHYFEPFVKHL